MTGKAYPVKWNKGSAGKYVRISLLKSGRHYRWISKKMLNDGRLTWKISVSVATSSNYKIRIQSVDKSRTDNGDRSFSITRCAGESCILQCEKNCGTLDKTNKFSFQARLAMGGDMSGANVTFIEDDSILSSAHVLGFDPDKKNTYSCAAEASKKKGTDWARRKNIYVVDGRQYPGKKIIIAKVLDISARATAFSPGYDIVIAHVDRNCKECAQGRKNKITPIPVANKIPRIKTKALHIVVPGRHGKMNKGRFYVPNLLNGRIWGSSANSCTRQTIKHDGKANPPMLFDASGSPVIMKECGQ